MAAQTLSWRERLARLPKQPVVKPIPPAMVARHGAGTILIPSPAEVEALMRQVPAHRLVTVFDLGDSLARRHGADIGCTVTTAILAAMIAKAADEDEHAGASTITPYWRTLKVTGELNTKYPGGVDNLLQRLEAEGHVVVQKGRRFVVEDFAGKLVRL